MFRDWPGLWQQLKAELAIPLQAGLCHAEGVALPGSLLMLPTEVKQCCFQNLEVRAKPGTDLSWQLQQERTLCAQQRISPAPAPALPTLTSDSMHNLRSPLAQHWHCICLRPTLASTLGSAAPQ